MLSPDRALRALVEDGISRGELAPGSKLPTERELVATLQLPRSAVRRALSRLEQEGMVVREVGRGTFLREGYVAEGVARDASPADIMQARMVLEPSVAVLAAHAATQADLARIASFADQGGRSEDFDSFETWDSKFHRAIGEATHNDLVLAMFDVINAGRALPVWGSLKRRTSTPERRRCYHQQHVSILETLNDRDPAGAERAMRAHLKSVTDNLIGNA